MNAQRFDDFFAQTRLNLDRDEHVQAVVYDGAPSQHNPGIPSSNTELKKLLPSILKHCTISNKYLESSNKSTHQPSRDTGKDE